MTYYWEHPACRGKGQVELEAMPVQLRCPNCKVVMRVLPCIWVAEPTVYDPEAIMKADLPALLMAILQRLDQLEIEVNKLRRETMTTDQALTEARQTTIVISGGLDAIPAGVRLADKLWLRYAYIRGVAAKRYGMRNQIEGKPERGLRAILVYGKDMDEATARGILEQYGIEVMEVRYEPFTY